MDRDPLLTPDEENQQEPRYPPWFGAALYVVPLTGIAIGLSVILELDPLDILLATWLFGALWKVCLIQEGG